MKFLKLISTLLAVVAVTVFAADVEEEDDVLVLTDDNFDEVVGSHDTLLVEFYAPWCGHCKNLTPEYAKAAAALKERDPPIRIAKMDATEHKTSAEKYGVQGFPTLKFFKGGNLDAEAAKTYDGGRTSEEIQKWIIKKSGPAVAIIDSADALTKLQEENEVVVLAVIDTTEGEQKDILEKVADVEDIAVIVATTDVSLHEDASKVGSVVLFKTFDEPKVIYDGAFDKDGLSGFISGNNKPLVMTFSQEQASKIFGGDVDQHLLVFADESKDYKDGLVEKVKVSAETNKGKLLHVVIPLTESRIVEYFGLKEEDLPAIIVVNMGAGMKKYPYDKQGDALIEASAEDILDYASKYLAGDLKPTLKSAEPTDDSEEKVKIMTGKEFQSRVMESDKDILLEFYAPWCGHCKTLAPKYEELAENFAGVDSIVISKMDATENEIDHPEVDVKGFPTIVFFPANDKAHPIVYKGDREVEALTTFLKENSKKFELDGETHGKDHDEL